MPPPEPEPPGPPEPLTNRIAEWRRLRNLTGAELARRCRTSPATITQLETGRRALTQAWLHRLAEVLSCLPVELLPHGGALDRDEHEVLALWRALALAERQRFKTWLAAPPAAPAAAPRPAARAPAAAPAEPAITATAGEPVVEVEITVDRDGGYRIRIYPRVKPP